VHPEPPPANAHFGESLANAGDLNGDGQDDIVVGAPDYTDAELGDGLSGIVYAMTSSGSSIWQAKGPFPQVSRAGASTGFGTKVAKLGDVGSCVPTGDGVNCTVGPPDGKAEVLVSAPGTDASSGTGIDQGAVYVLDGASGLTLKPVRLASLPSQGTAGFGKSIVSLSGQPACERFGGIGGCAYADDSAVAVGDATGGGEPDFAVGAPDFSEDENTLEGVCVGVCPGLGRVYIFPGEAITGSSQTALTENGTDTIVQTHPGAIGAGEPPHYGASLAPIGDIGACSPAPPAKDCLTSANPSSAQPDGAPELAVGAPGADAAGAEDAGTVFLVDAAANAAMAQLSEPNVTAASGFGAFDQGFPAVGDLGAGNHPDVLVPSPSSGAAVAYSGDPFGPSPFASLANPTPGAAFATAVAGLGDIAGDAPTEVALGAAGGAVHIASACANRILKTIDAPPGEEGARFGVTVAPIGDRNSDGFIDLAVGAPLSAGGAGRVYTFTSSGPATAFAGCSPASNPGPGGGAKTTPGATVRARVLRRLALVPSKRRVKRGSALRLTGRLKASAGQAACQRRQKIAVQRRKLSGGRFQTFEVAVTTKTGSYKTSTRPSRTYLYRARVSQTARCMGAMSKRAKVVVRKRAKGGSVRR
jgi:hypothetical protein